MARLCLHAPALARRRGPRTPSTRSPHSSCLEDLALVGITGAAVACKAAAD